ncbi:metal ABC transporter ATP-binding protein [Micromonospora sp. MS34]|uniref:metal ABC transporter ATP-binding protein n=1 Tax=Micromonospora sp. MS34 TaxID=3385971 RepID=UPI0039A3D9BD
MAHDDETVLRVSGLTVVLDNRRVIDDLTFAVKRGEIFTILGPNGAGKTVLLRALLGFLPYEGSISWAEGATLGYVPQRLPHIRDIPINVTDFFALKGEATPRARDLLPAVGLGADLAAQRMGDLSSGQFQRILIAWGLAGDPQVLLFDEPTAGIDVGGEETVYGLLARLHRERSLTMLLVTHDLAMVHRFSTTVLCLNKRAVCQGLPQAVLTPERLQQLYGSGLAYYQHTHE